MSFLETSPYLICTIGGKAKLPWSPGRIIAGNVGDLKETRDLLDTAGWKPHRQGLLRATRLLTAGPDACKGIFTLIVVD